MLRREKQPPIAETSERKDGMMYKLGRLVGKTAVGRRIAVASEFKRKANAKHNFPEGDKLSYFGHQVERAIASKMDMLVAEEGAAGDSVRAGLAFKSRIEDLFVENGAESFDRPDYKDRTKHDTALQMDIDASELPDWVLGDLSGSEATACIRRTVHVDADPTQPLQLGTIRYELVTTQKRGEFGRRTVVGFDSTGNLYSQQVATRGTESRPVSGFEVSPSRIGELFPESVAVESAAN